MNRVAPVVSILVAILLGGCTTTSTTLPGPGAGDVFAPVQPIPPSLEVSAWSSLSTRARQLSPGFDSRLGSGGFGGANEDVMNARWELGSQSLAEVSRGIATVNTVLRGVQSAARVDVTGTAWVAEDSRNFWDRVGQYGTAAGLGFSTGAAFWSTSDRGTQFAWLGAGLVVAGVSKALGALFGTQNGERYGSHARRVEVTRRAYDELQTVNILTAAEIQANEGVRTELADFQRRYDGVSGAIVQRSWVIDGSGYLDRFDAILGQIPTAVARYASVVERYCPGAVRAAADRGLQTHRCRIVEGGEVYELEGAPRRKLLDLALYLAAMEREIEAAMQVRQLTHQFRGALLTDL